MIHKLFKIYHFINEFKANELIKLDKNITVIFRNYKNKTDKEKLVKINDFEQLIDICYKKKEIKLKYELETNVNLVSFENKKIEISFNENLDKNFVKDLSTKLFEWTNSRWIITFSQKVGANTKKQENKNKKLQLVSLAKDTENYRKIIAFFPDAELINIETLDKKKDE